MSHEVDRSYYQRRAQEERAKAERASDLMIRRSHELLAEVYERKIAAPVPSPQPHGPGHPSQRHAP